LFSVALPFVMSLIPLLFRQLPATWGEEIGEAKSAASNSYPLPSPTNGISSNA